LRVFGGIGGDFVGTGCNGGNGGGKFTTDLQRGNGYDHRIGTSGGEPALQQRRSLSSGSEFCGPNGWHLSGHGERRNDGLRLDSGIADSQRATGYSGGSNNDRYSSGNLRRCIDDAYGRWLRGNTDLVNGSGWQQHYSFARSQYNLYGDLLEQWLCIIGRECRCNG